MKRLVLPLCIAALGLAACAGTTVKPAMSTAAASAPIVPQALAYNTGYGRVESVLLKETQSSVSGGTATGASNHPAGTSATDRPEPPVGVPSTSAGRGVRLGIRMDNGTLQYVDTDSDQFPKGTRVLLRSDNVIEKAP